MTENTWLFIAGVIAIIIGVGLSIALHEAAHMFFAKRYGLIVDRFFLGFGPTLWSTKRGETEYGIKLIPLGGFVSMGDMEPPSAEEKIKALEAEKPAAFTPPERAYYSLSLPKKLMVICSGAVVNLLLAIVLAAIALSVIGVDQRTRQIDVVAPCVTAQSYTDCTSADPESPAQKAGFKSGDVIISIDGVPMESQEQVGQVIGASAGKTLTVVARRAGEQVTLYVTPVPRDSADASSPGMIGITTTVEHTRFPIWYGPAEVLKNTAKVGSVIWSLPQKITQTLTDMLTGQPRDPNAPVSVVGLGALAGEGATQDVSLETRAAFVVGLVSSMNIALFVFNLIPLPPLDGGQAAVAIIDSIRQKIAKKQKRPAPEPLTAKKLAPLTTLVTVFLVVSGAILIIADIINPLQLFG